MRKLWRAGIRYLTGIIVLVGCWVSPGLAAEESVFGKLAFTYETPHISWAKPYAGKKLRILVIAPVGSQRESVELWQRLECEIVPLMTAGYEKFTISANEAYGPGYMETEDVLALSREAVSTDWDVAVVGRFQWDAIPPDIRVRLLLGVRDRGAGLVIIDQGFLGRPLSKELDVILLKEPLEDERGFLNYALPWKDLSVFRSPPLFKPFLKMAKFGKGQVINLEYWQKGELIVNEITQCLTPAQRANPNGRSELQYSPNSPDYDYYLSLVIKCILWAGKGEENTRFKWFSLPQVDIERSRLQKETTLFNPWPTGADRQHWWIREKAKVRFWIEGNIKPPTVLEWVIRNPWNEIEVKGKIDNIHLEPLLGGAIELPILPHGQHYLEIWLKRNEKIVDWGIISFKVKGECEPAMIELDKISFDKDEEIRGRVVLIGGLPVGANVSVEIWDNLGRLLVKKSLADEGLIRPFNITIPDPITQTYTARAVVRDEMGIVSESRTEFLMPVRGNDDYQFHVWAMVKDEPVSKSVLKRLKELGVDSIFFNALWAVPDYLYQQSWVLSRLNLRLLPYLSTFCGWEDIPPVKKDEEGNSLCSGKLKCLFDTEFGGQQFSRLKEEAFLMAPFAPLSYCLSEEDGLDFKHTDLCFDPPSLEDFRRFLKKGYENITRLNQSWGTNYNDFSECTPITFEKAKKTEQFSRWVDHRLHMTEGWTNFHIRLAEPIRQGDPRTIPLFFPSNMEPYFGNDPWRLQHVSRAGSVLSTPWENSVGGSDTEEVVSFSSPGVYLAPTYGTYQGSYYEDNMRLQPWMALAGGCNGNEWWVVYDGNVSQGNMMALTPSLEETEKHFGETMEEVREIKSGISKLLLNSKLRDDGIRIFYSYSSMLVSEFSHSETTWLEARNNLILALRDVGLGCRMISYEQVSGKELRYPEVKVLFLPYAQSISPDEANAILEFARSGGVVIADFSPGIMDEHGKRLGRNSLEELFPKKEDLSIHEFGKGKGVYLGNLLRDYNRQRYSIEACKTVKELLHILKRVADIKPQYSIQAKDGNPIPALHGAVFDDGKSSYLLLLREVRGKPPVEANIEFGHPGEIYDIREEKYIGHGGKVEVTLPSFRAKLLALLPYKVESLNITAAAGSGRAIPVNARVSVNFGVPGRHIFRLTVIGPDGKEISYLARNLVALEGKYEDTFHLALNDPAGKYIFRFRDIASGVCGQTEVLIE